MPGFFQRGLERCNEVMRQIADETDGIAQKHFAPVGEPPLPRARVERREELVLDVDAGAGEGVHEGALAGVGIADKGNDVLFAAAGDFALLALLHVGKAIAQVANALRDDAAVFFELGFAGAAQADAALVARQVGPHLAQAGQGVFELGELDLQARLVAAGARGEDVEDEFGAIQDLDSFADL